MISVREERQIIVGSPRLWQRLWLSLGRRCRAIRERLSGGVIGSDIHFKGTTLAH